MRVIPSLILAGILCSALSARAADAPAPAPTPKAQPLPPACASNAIVESVLDSRFMSARDAEQLASNLCQQIMDAQAKGAAATKK
jgi:hypothetical protein